MRSILNMSQDQSGKTTYEDEENVEVRVQTFLDCTIVQISSYSMKGTLILHPEITKELLTDNMDIIFDAIESTNQGNMISRNEKPI